MQIELAGCSGRHPAAQAGAPAALRGLDLRVETGEQVAVIGPSGAGKTTLLHLLACALPPSGGALNVAGQDPWRLPPRALRALRGRLFLAPQVPPLPPRQRVVTAVLAGRLPHLSLLHSLRSLFYPSDIPGADAALARFDLADKLFHRVDRLSGGERQRVGLARALVALAPFGTPHPNLPDQPGASLLLVDEPLSALDPARAQQALQALTGAARARGATLVATLHHVDMALAHFPRIVGLRDGERVFDLPAASVTPALLRALYDRHLDELTGPAAAVADEVPGGPQPVAMHCR